MRRSQTLVLMFLTLIFTTQCGKSAPPAELTKESAQRTVEAWAKTKSFAGEVIVEKMDSSGMATDVASAHLKFNGFSYTWEGRQRNYSDTGLAHFKRDSGGRWILYEVHLFQISGGAYPAFKAEVEVSK